MNFHTETINSRPSPRPHKKTTGAIKASRLSYIYLSRNFLLPNPWGILSLSLAPLHPAPLFSHTQNDGVHAYNVANCPVSANHATRKHQEKTFVLLLKRLLLLKEPAVTGNARKESRRGGIMEGGRKKGTEGRKQGRREALSSKKNVQDRQLLCKHLHCCCCS